jgi:uncharacterized protein
MTDQTANAVIDFIRGTLKERKLRITWYGGEPLLALGRIEYITSRIKLDKIPLSAYMITNGYLLTKDVVQQLAELSIDGIQVTLDGLGSAHNERRRHPFDPDSYSTILKNLELLHETWTGACRIRINVDQDNMHLFYDTYSYLRARLPRFPAYPGMVFPGRDASRHEKCLGVVEKGSLQEWVLLSNSDGTFPVRPYSYSCSATAAHAFVVGPDGRLYKCWHDVDNEECAVGDVFGSGIDSEAAMKYVIHGDPTHDPKCSKCQILPICGGGCPKQRMNSEVGSDANCAHFKITLRTLLTAWADRCGNKRPDKEVQG